MLINAGPRTEQITINCDRLNVFLQIAMAWGEVLRNVLLLVGRRKTRDREQVQTEYNNGRWKQILETREWLRSANLKEFLRPVSNEMRVAKLGNQYVRILTRDYYDFRAAILGDVIDEFTCQEFELVELGCGVGMNLFSLKNTNCFRRLYGFDVSENAVRAGKQISQHFGLTDSISFDRIDLVGGAHSKLSAIKGKVVFTHYCLEQLKYDTSTVILNIRNACPKRVIHIEPTVEMYDLLSPKDLAN